MPQKTSAAVQNKLEEELQRILTKLGLNLDLRVVWTPDPPYSLSGEVRDNTIYIYEVEEEKAIQALKHEVIDYLITSRIIKPLVSLINLLIKAREAEIYEEKEEIVEALSKIME